MNVHEIDRLLRRLRMWVRKRERRGLECEALLGAIRALELLREIRAEQEAKVA